MFATYLHPGPGQVATNRRLHDLVVTEAATVLVAEDDSDLRELFATILSTAGYGVVAVRDGVEATEVLQERSIDLVLTDMWMPRVSGLDLCKRLRANPATTRLPVLVISAYGSWRGKEEALLVGANDYIAKPVRASSLLSKVEAIVGKPPPPPPPGPVELEEMASPGRDSARPGNRT
jgi:DNA-binding response OmpR family regulator